MREGHKLAGPAGSGDDRACWGASSPSSPSIMYMVPGARSNSGSSFGVSIDSVPEGRVAGCPSEFCFAFALETRQRPGRDLVRQNRWEPLTGRRSSERDRLLAPLVIGVVAIIAARMTRDEVAHPAAAGAESDEAAAVAVAVETALVTTVS